eukprot:CAMPEP_0172363438 /NCGR_PEP_ID=MMETSP1060-20121228/6799_1 /TAXON_ID=37318 /ORGANISM="Pseudo-nitzschia pungens, Strain cf. cingulata" /LENGTH=639 /DNA_ID=CAMNT_0013086177 /DNA_START=428 /DNA_END=2347 /DNA_ORIENTATION=+
MLSGFADVDNGLREALVPPSDMHPVDDEATHDRRPPPPNEKRYNPHQMTAMISNFSTSYNVVSISLVLPILNQLCSGGESVGASNDANKALVASSLLGGMILGQLVGGALGDSCLGRMGALRLVMALQIASSLASANVSMDVDVDVDTFDYDSNSDCHCDTVWWDLAVRRFLLGIGCGGVYPLAAVLSAETDGSNHNHNNKSSVERVVQTFATQGLGFVSVPLAAVLLLAITSDRNVVWRVLLGLGAVPGIVLVLLQGWEFGKEWLDRDRNSNANSNVAPFSELGADAASDGELENDSVLASMVGDDFGDDEDESRDGLVADPDVNDHGDDNNGHGGSGRWLQTLLHEPGLGRKVLGTAGTWFLFDVVFYGNTIFQPIVVAAAFGTHGNGHGNGHGGGDTPIAVLRKTALDSLILTSIALPGYAVAGWAMGKRDKSSVGSGCRSWCRSWCCDCSKEQSPRYVMLQGFAAMAVLYATIGANWTYLEGEPSALVTLYGLTFFFANYGPNTATFVLPSMVFEKEHRSTWNGVSAACGKLGALVGATLFAPASDELGDGIVLLVCAGVALAAFVLTWVAVPEAGVDVQVEAGVDADEDAGVDADVDADVDVEEEADVDADVDVEEEADVDAGVAPTTTFNERA